MYHVHTAQPEAIIIAPLIIFRQQLRAGCGVLVKLSIRTAPCTMYWYIALSLKPIEFMPCMISYTVLIGLPPGFGYLSYMSLRTSSYTTWIHRCTVSCARSALKFSGKENTKRTNGVRAACGAFLFLVLFGYIVVFNTFKEPYP